MKDTLHPNVLTLGLGMSLQSQNSKKQSFESSELSLSGREPPAHLPTPAQTLLRSFSKVPIFSSFSDAILQTNSRRPKMKQNAQETGEKWPTTDLFRQKRHLRIFYGSPSGRLKPRFLKFQTCGANVKGFLGLLKVHR